MTFFAVITLCVILPGSCAFLDQISKNLFINAGKELAGESLQDILAKLKLDTRVLINGVWQYPNVIPTDLETSKLLGRRDLSSVEKKLHVPPLERMNPLDFKEAMARGMVFLNGVWQYPNLVRSEFMPNEIRVKCLFAGRVFPRSVILSRIELPKPTDLGPLKTDLESKAVALLD